MFRVECLGRLSPRAGGINQDLLSPKRRVRKLELFKC